MTQVINIQPITRIEGHASIGIQLDDSGNVEEAKVNFMSLRGFEKFVEGKPAEELPRIVNRICGICPWMHHLASNKAVDGCFGVTPTPAGSKLRELMQTISHAEDKLLHFFFLAAADFVIGPDSDYAVRNVIGIVKSNPELAQQVVKTRQMAKMILDKFSRKTIHPVAGVPGGFAKPLLEEERRDILDKMRQILDFAMFTIDFAKKEVFPKYLDTIKMLGVINTGFIGTVDDDGALNLYEGKLRLMKADGTYTDFAAADYADHIAEKVVPVMNAEEMRTLILSHYESESQTLTTGAEANLLKFEELTGWMTPEEAQRWADIKKTFRKNLLLRGASADNPVTQVVAQLSAFQDGLTDIRDAITRGGGGTRIDFSEQTLDRLSDLAGHMKEAVAAASDDRPEQTALLKVIQSQFEVMNGWMAPILENSRQTGQNIQKLARDIQGLKSVYRELMQAGPSDLKAIEQFDLALKINPRDDATYYKRGLALYNRGDTSRALQDFKNALDLLPKNKKYQRIVAHLEAELTTDKRE